MKPERVTCRECGVPGILRETVHLFGFRVGFERDNPETMWTIRDGEARCFDCNHKHAERYDTETAV